MTSSQSYPRYPYFEGDGRLGEVGKYYIWTEESQCSIDDTIEFEEVLPSDVIWIRDTNTVPEWEDLFEELVKENEELKRRILDVEDRISALE